MAKTIKVGNEAREALRNGANQLTDPVRCTLGPLGRYVTYDHFDGSTPHVTKDGVSVAKQVELEDPVENAGAQLLKSAAAQAGDQMGDGTTTTTVLATSIINEAVKAIIDDGANPVRLKHGIDDAARFAIDKIADISMPVETFEHVAFIATISANNDEELGAKVAEAFESAGDYGVIKINKNSALKDRISVPAGAFFDRGWESPYFLETGKDTVEWDSSDSPIAVLQVDAKLESLSKTELDVISNILSGGFRLVLMAEEFDTKALDSLVGLNRTYDKTLVVAVRSPGFQKRRKDLSEDLSAMWGGVVVPSIESVVKNSQIDLSVFGAPKTFNLEQNRTVFTIHDSAEVQQRIGERLELLKKLKEDDSLDNFEHQTVLSRMALLGGKVVEITVGAISELAFLERRDRFDDAIRAVSSAKESGYLPGGGSTHLYAYALLKQVDHDKLHPDYILGYQMFTNALTKPFIQILTNAGETDPIDQANWINDIVEAGKDNPNFGLNVKTFEFGDMVEMGVIDPTKVTVEALGIAASTASMFITMDAVIVEKREK